MSENINQKTGEVLKAWNERSNQEKAQSIAELHKSIIAKTCKEKKQFWNKDRSKEEIDKSLPYNPKTGKPYLGVTSIVLQCVAELNNYKEPQFLSMKQANTLGGKLKKLKDEKGNTVISEKTGKEQYAQGIKILLKKDYELVPKLNDKGEQIMDSKNQPVMEKQFLPKPIMETVTLYHVSQFDDLKLDRLKPKDMDEMEIRRSAFRNTEAKPSMKKLYELGLNANTQRDIEMYLNAQNKGIDFKAIEREQTQEKTQAKKQEKKAEKQHERAR